MRPPDDPTVFQASRPEDAIVLSGMTVPGIDNSSVSMFDHYNEECVVLTGSFSGDSHGTVATALAAETAIWAYKQIRLRHFYWKDKLLLMRRIFRSTNITLWQKRREANFSDGVPAMLLVAIIGDYTVWIGNAGGCRAYLLHNGRLTALCPPARGSEQGYSNEVGLVRYGLKPFIRSFPFMRQDSMLLLSQYAAHLFDESLGERILNSSGSTKADLTSALATLFASFKPDINAGPVSACLLKRISFAF